MTSEPPASDPFPPYPAAFYPPPPRPSQAMSIWALVLSFVWCLPIALLVAIGLAIAVLVRSRTGANAGRGKAVAAIVLSTLGLLAWIGLVVAGVLGAFDEAHRGSDGQVTTSGSILTRDLRVGDCFDHQGPGVGRQDTVMTVRVVPCSQPHQWEAFHRFDLTGSGYPGDDQVRRLAIGGCVDAWAAFDGVPAQRSRLHVYYLFPRALQWSDGDRRVLCSMGLDDPTIVGSLRNSRR